MDRDQKAAAIEEVAAQIEGSEAVFAIDYRGISVPQAAELRQRLSEAGASFRIVKNTLTERAADQVGAEELKQLLEGPTAFTFVSPDGGDVAMAAKALAAFRREHDVLDFKGGLMGGAAVSAEEIVTLSRLPAREVLNQQFVGMVAAPITGLVRGLNALISGLAIQLSQIAEQGLVRPAEEAPAEEAATTDDAAEAEPESDSAAEPESDSAAEAEEPAAEEPHAESDEAEQQAEEPEAEASAEETEAVETEPEEAPSEGESDKEG